MTEMNGVGMDASLLGVICGFAGTVVGAVVAYFAPLQVERLRSRNNQQERAESQRIAQQERAESQTTADISRYTAVRAVVDQWLDLLRRAHGPAVDGRLNLERFDEDAVRYSDELRLRLAELAHLRITDTGTGDLFRGLRQATELIRRLADGQDDSVYDTDRRGDHCWRWIESCRNSRSDWAMLVLDRLSLRTGHDFSPQQGRMDQDPVS
ncbi:hypothetical protein [Kitasatospora sp. NPDC096204]|uniref:hypothetical protein n=1 Tax=Kitasatospora sp. NPDC096204 TaxID=3364094 RepID=UPI003828EB4E